MDQPTEAQRPERGTAAATPRRVRPRVVVVVALGVAVALAVGSAALAWSADARAASLAAQIDGWHDAHELAGCELTVRIVRAVALEDRSADVLEAAADVERADALLGERQRSGFAVARADLLASLRHAAFVTDDDRELAARWTAAARSRADFDLLGACTGAAVLERPERPLARADSIAELERELRSLGDPRDFDDARIDGLEAAIARLGPAAVALAESRTASADLDAAYRGVPADLRDPLDGSEARVAALLGALDGGRSATAVLDLVEGLTLHVAAAWAADAWQLQAEGERREAAARADAAERARDAIRDAAPRPITDPPGSLGGLGGIQEPPVDEPGTPTPTPTPSPSPTAAPTPTPSPTPSPTPPSELVPPTPSPSPTPGFSFAPAPKPTPIPIPTPPPTP